MNNIIKFLIFIFYCSIIFFLPNNEYILCLFLINLILMFILKVNIKKITRKMIDIFPFIIFTFLINCLLDEYVNSFFIALKLIIVCNATFIYSTTTTVVRSFKNNRNIMYAFENIQD